MTFSIVFAVVLFALGCYTAAKLAGKCHKVFELALCGGMMVTHFGLFIGNILAKSDSTIWASCAIILIAIALNHFASRK
ncbi:hypothetical protein OFDDKENP_00171 [Aeromonas phage B614]|nr:hypothetical protein Ah13A_015 [Aeromonas phage AhMtk13a]UYD57547.1 hypothetical protein OFDDKENP_00171 [Aeromonas phage B614]UYD58101.1 hypothetical protein JNEOFJEA_00004 [Aeromonas phage UP87]UYD58465.1 hypothetical protein IPAKJDPM_00122 [Aeromonas phage avDM14-QBC]UYD58681.1 hypothetical protein HNNIDBEH_00088 [Aeromonas phage avDM10-HWA]UYD59016.1 hypothetical protein OFOPOMKI_00166 [Aeromonas phage avDM7-IJDJ]UYD59828.1 hypothetical protein LEHPIFIF_00055 [Aeromonas phage avDM9-HANS